MQFVDKALARRLEAAEEIPQVNYARLYQTLKPEIGADYEPICGGHMIFAGIGSPIGRVTGAGFDGPVTSADLDRMEAFYCAHNAPTQVDVCPLTDAAWLAMLKDREYTFTEFNNVLYRQLKDEAFPAAAAIRRGGPEDAAVCSAVVERSFFPDGGGPEDFAGMFMPLFQMEGAMVFVVELEGKIVACGGGLVIPEHGILALFGAGTLPEYRRRGLQTALFQTRMAAGLAVGCEYAVVVTQAGTTSQRNAERLGFRVAYTKATLVKNL